MPQQGRALVFIHLDGALLDDGHLRWHRVDFDAHGFVQKRLGQGLDRLRKGGGEEQILPTLRQQSQHSRQFVREPQIEHPVCLIEHQRGDMAEMQRIFVHEIEQSARRGDHKVRTTTQRHHLGIDRDTADRTHDLDALRQMHRATQHRLRDLRRQFTRGHQDQRVDASRLLQTDREPALQQREHKRHRLARSRLRRGQHIAAFQHHGNGRRLHRRRRDVVADGAQEGWRQTEGGEGHYVL